LLARVFFLAFGKASSTSFWHPNLQSSIFGNDGLRIALQSSSELKQRQNELACPGSSPVLTSSTHPRKLVCKEVAALPAGLTGLACVTLIVVAAATASTAAEALSAPASAWGVGLRLRFVDLQCASAQLSSVQCSDRFVRFCRVRHLDESEAPGAAGLAIRNNADALDCSVCLKQAAKLRFGGAVR
jgi:hypothetical protein